MTSAKERRSESRTNPSLRFTPVSCTLVISKNKIPIEIINYHYRGACLRVGKNDYRAQEKGAYLQFKIGNKDLPEKILYRMTWETIQENGYFGVEFETESSYVLARAERFSTHAINTPVISAQDPLDPNRILYFKVVNASATGMLLATSLTNKHLFPGMELRTAILDIPGIGKTDVDLFIENSRPGIQESDKNILYGVSVKGMSHNYNSLMAKYLSNLGGSDLQDERLTKLSQANFLQKNLRTHLTIREVKTEDEYKSVLKLRHLGYARAGKIADTKTWQEMGEGLNKEGIILAAYLGGQVIASCEFRFYRSHGLRISQHIDIHAIPEVRDNNLSEVNKLVVHPDAQSSDIVLGIFQKIHTLAILNGKPDGIILAENKLISLYERLGFKKTNVKVPHPVKKDTQLNVMIIYKEAYISSEGMNPYAWSVAFEETQNFFDAIGVQRTKNLDLRKKAVRFLTPLALKIFKNKKKKENLGEKKENSKVDQSRTIADPEWTKQHLNATVMLPYILESNSLIGNESTNKLLLEYSFNLEYFKSASNWVSIDFFDDFIEKFSKYGDPYLLNKKAGFRSVTKEILGANYYIVKHFFSPKTAFKTFERFLPKFNKTRIYKVIESGSNFCRIKITQPDKTLLPKHPSAKENWFAITEAYVLALTGNPAKIESIKSSFDGDPHCEFIVTWTNPLFSFRSLLLVSASLFAIIFPAMFVIHKFGYADSGKYLAILSLPALTVFFFWRFRSFKKKYHDMLDSISEVESHADERYRELQNSKSILETSYQEGKILETISREIQNSEELSKIFEIALNAVCTKFDLKRAFIMIADESSKILRTASAFGADSPIEELWNFKVDISATRENPLVLSSVFHSGQSILIQNVDEHKFHLNEASKRLIDRLNTKGFAIVPIPGENKNWGVIVADKGQQSNVITRRDLVALQRVSQAIGLALDKKAKIESEIQIRKIFQKYVPSAVIESTLGAKEPKLGGQSKDATCLFLDIRNFTTLSSQVPPQILCEILNGIFDLLQKTLSQSNGVIDKFLGDGALVTWGVIPGSEAGPFEILKSTQNFLEALELLNKDIELKGLKKIEVGIGIHSGKVIAGNIGSQERMEFTVIGSTVNLASRLEQLSKVFKCQIVISEDFIPFEKLPSHWKIYSDVQVRGLSASVNVATYSIEPPTFDNKSQESA